MSEDLLYFRGVPPRAYSRETCNLAALDRRVHLYGRKGTSFCRLKAVHADDDSLVPLDGLLIIISRLLNFPLDVSGFNRPQHPAKRVDFRMYSASPRFNSSVKLSRA